MDKAIDDNQSEIPKTAANSTEVFDCTQCMSKLSADELVRFSPCGCFTCKDCMIQFLAKTRQETVLKCTKCRATIKSHRFKTRKEDVFQYEYIQEQNGNSGNAMGAESQASENKMQNNNKQSVNSIQAASTNSQIATQSLKVDDASTPLKAAPHQNILVQGNDPTNSSNLTAPSLESPSVATTAVTTPKAGRVKEVASGENTENTAEKPKRKRGRPPKGVKVDKTPKKKIRTRKSFEERVQSLRDFKEKHGHCQVPYKYEPDRSLGEWVKDVRRGHLKVTKEKRKILNSIGFNWETRSNQFEREWSEAFSKLKRYKEKHGNCAIPWKYEYDQALADWVHYQRKLGKKQQIRADRRAILDSIGFDWAPKSSRKVVKSERSTPISPSTKDNFLDETYPSAFSFT